MFLAFKKAFQDYPVISLNDIRKRFPEFDRRRLIDLEQLDHYLNAMNSTIVKTRISLFLKTIYG